MSGLWVRYEWGMRDYEWGMSKVWLRGVKYEISEIKLFEGWVRNECKVMKVLVWRKWDIRESIKWGMREEWREEWLKNKVRVSECVIIEIWWRLREI